MKYIMLKNDLIDVLNRAGDELLMYYSKAYDDFEPFEYDEEISEDYVLLPYMEEVEWNAMYIFLEDMWCTPSPYSRRDDHWSMICKVGLKREYLNKEDEYAMKAMKAWASDYDIDLDWSRFEVA